MQDHNHPYSRILAAIHWVIASSWLAMMLSLALV